MTQLLKAIAIYTFFGLWADKTVKSKKVTMVVLVALWSFIAVMVIIGFMTNTNFFGPARVSDFGLYLVVVLMQCNRTIVVLVLDSSCHSRRLGLEALLRIFLALGHSGYLIDNLHPALLVDEGQCCC